MQAFHSVRKLSSPSERSCRATQGCPEKCHFPVPGWHAGGVPAPQYSSPPPARSMNPLYSACMWRFGSV